MYLEWDKIETGGWAAYAYRAPDRISKLLVEHLSTVAQEYGTLYMDGAWQIDETLLNQLGIIVYIDGYRVIKFTYSTGNNTYGRSNGKTENSLYFYWNLDGSLDSEDWLGLGGGA